MGPQQGVRKARPPITLFRIRGNTSKAALGGPVGRYDAVSVPRMSSAAEHLLKLQLLDHLEVPLKN